LSSLADRALRFRPSVFCVCAGRRFGFVAVPLLFSRVHGSCSREDVSSFAHSYLDVLIGKNRVGRTSSSLNRAHAWLFFPFPTPAEEAANLPFLRPVFHVAMLRSCEFSLSVGFFFFFVTSIRALSSSSPVPPGTENPFVVSHPLIPSCVIYARIPSFSLHISIPLRRQMRLLNPTFPS